MALIEWTDKMALNILEVDRQHQKLVGLINELDDAMQHGRGRDVVGAVLERLVDYTVYHFGTEEHLLETHNYPGSVRHKLQHVEFVKKLIEFRDALARREISLSIQVMSYLSDWLVDHIQGTDRQYVGHLAERGVVQTAGAA